MSTMKVLEVIVTSCADCHHCNQGEDLGFTCITTNRVMTAEEHAAIPKWCPLEDYPAAKVAAE